MRWPVVACCLLAGTVHASDAADIVRLINAYRAAPAECAGRIAPAVAPLQADARLAQVQLGPGSFLQQEMARAGYRARQAEAVGVQGATDPPGVMQLLRQRHCAVLRNGAASDIGVVPGNGGWTIIVAREDIVAPLPTQAASVRAILDATNRARATARQCGNQYFPAALPLASNAALNTAALLHSTEMATLRYFSHQGKDGSQVGERATRAGYAWRHIGENIASGMRSPEEAVAGWVASPGHCANLMNPGFTEMGSGFAQSQDPDTGIVFWTQVFGRSSR
jgi:uncharacterized protein YkwD